MTMNPTTNGTHLQPVKDAIHKEDIKSDLRKMTTHLREDASELSHDIKDYASSKAEDTIAELRAKLRELKSQGRSELSHLEQKITERPTRSVAIAFLAGAVLSAFFGRR